MSSSDTEMPHVEVPDADVRSIDLLDLTRYRSMNLYRKGAKRLNRETDRHTQATVLLMKDIDNEIYSNIENINSEIERVLSFEQDSRQLVEAFENRSQEYENRLKAQKERLDELFHQFQNVQASHDETCGSALLEFEQEKRKLIAKLVEMRTMEKDARASIAASIEKINEGVQMRREIHDDLKGRITAEGRTFVTAGAAITGTGTLHLTDPAPSPAAPLEADITPSSS